MYDGQYNSGQRPDDVKYGTGKSSKGKKKKNFAGKLLGAVITGLVFGVTAGGAATGVLKYTGVLDAIEKASDISAQSGVSSAALAGAGSTVTDEDGTVSQEEKQVNIAEKSLTPDVNEPDSDSAQTDESGEDSGTVTYATYDSTDVSDVVARVMPAMVSINNTYVYRSSNMWGQTYSQEAVSSGSGIIVGINDAELLIATNYHVIENTDELVVSFTDNTEAAATVKGTDEAMDLAVIAVPVTDISSETRNNITVATLGDSESLVVGEPAIAIGNALGYGQSVSTGVISALNREMEMSDGKSGVFIQTDAAINPGNSGGALLNIEGEVIGINSNKIGGSSVEGMGYAIPISSAEPIISELMLNQERTAVSEDQRGYLGVSGITVTSDISESYGMPLGVYIAKVYSGSAADGAGLMQGDIITAIDGNQITSWDELGTELEYHKMGDVISLTYMTPTSAGYVEVSISLTLSSRGDE